MDDQRPWLALTAALLLGTLLYQHWLRAPPSREADDAEDGDRGPERPSSEAKLEVTLVEVLSLLMTPLGPLESCRLQCLCRNAAFSSGELRHIFQEWGDELSLAKLAGAEQDATQVASAMRRAAAVAALAGRVVELWAPDAMGRPALVTAAGNRRAPATRRTQLLRALLQQRAQPEARSADGWDALMWSAQLGNCEDCRILLEARASPNAVSSDGTSPLLCAVRADAAPLEVVKLLLAYRADPALVPMQSPFDEYVDMDVREALARAPQQR